MSELRSAITSADFIMAAHSNGQALGLANKPISPYFAAVATFFFPSFSLSFFLLFVAALRSRCGH